MKIIEEVYKNTDTGIEAIDGVIDSVDNEAMRESLKVQRDKLSSIRDEAAEMLDEDALKRSKISILEKGMMKGGIALNSMMDKSSEKFAEMMIEGTNMGVNSLQKEINKLQTKNQEIPQIATELHDLYLSHLTDMRQYL